ncbi:MAG: sugar ABC transporter permease [Actinobacteria bacterium]|nr:sugar ABC transporter permease [Actinomycetota bacterium]
MSGSTTLAEAVPPATDLPEAGGSSARTAWTRLWERSQTLLPTLVALVLLFGMLTYAQIAYGRVYQAGTISSLLISFAPQIILAVGMTIVIASAGIDLSVGAVVAFSSVSGVMLLNLGWNGWITIVLMIVFGALFGLLAGVLVQYFTVQPFIATLAMMFLARGLASILSTTPVVVPEDSPILLLATEWKIIDEPKVANDFTITPGLLIAVVVVIGAVFFLHRTRMGRTVYGIGGNESSTQLMGLPVARTRVWIYIISGALAGLAGVVYTAEVGKAQNITGIGWELDAIAAVVIGGTLLTGGAGYVLGSIVGVFVIAALRLIITKDGGINPEYLTIITGGVLLAFVLLQRALTSRSKK